MTETGRSYSLLVNNINRDQKSKRRPYKFDELEMRWFKASLNCDFETLKKCYCEDETLLNKRDHFTALIHWVAKKDRLDILRWLIQNKVDLNNRTGHTALHVATMQGNEHIISKLIHEFDADVSLRDYSGRTPRQYLHKDSSVSVRRALNCVPQVVLVKPSDMPGSPRPLRNRSLPPSLSMPAIFGESSTDGNNNNHQETIPKKKRVLSISQSFKRNKKVLVAKIDQTDSSTSPRNKSEFEHDIHENGNDNLWNNHNSLQIAHPNYVDNPSPTSPRNNLHLERKASENIVNGYAGFINDNKYHAKTPEEPVSKQQWAINTWV